MINVGNIVPIDYLEMVKGRPFHLILAHMVKQSVPYREFYKEEAKNGATIILDNSSFELGDEWATPTELVDIYKSLKSDNIFLMSPEVAFDGLASARAVYNFKELLSSLNLSPKLFGTVHGRSFDEVRKCYLTVNELVDYIGFSYRIWCDDLPVKYPVPAIERGLMRITLLNTLVEEGVVNTQKPHHLLGISDPCEIYAQSHYFWIKSADSSTSYIHAKNNVWFTSNGLGTSDRVTEKINFDDKFSSFTSSGLYRNITQLDMFAKGEKVW